MKTTFAIVLFTTNLGFLVKANIFAHQLRSRTAQDKASTQTNMNFHYSTETEISELKNSLPRQSITEVIASDLSSYVSSLKFYISDQGLHCDKFRNTETKLTKKLSDIQKRVEQLSPYRPILSSLGFTKHMLQVMKDVAAPLKFDSISNFEFHLLRSILHLNVKILTLFDSHGAPMFGFSDFKEKVARFSSLVRFWKDLSRRLACEDQAVCEVLDRQFERAEISTKVLREARNKNIDFLDWNSALL